MKILHTADWHLGNVFHGHDRTLEHRHFLQWLLTTIATRRPDVLIVSGDVFDTANPPARAEQLFFDFLSQAAQAAPGMQTVIIAGNHDSAARLEAPAALLRAHNVYVRGTIHYTEKGEPDIDHLMLPLAPIGQSEAQCVAFAVPYLRAADYPPGLTPQQGLQWYFSQLHQHLKKSDFRGLPIVAVAHFYAAGADLCANGHSERVVIGGQECVDASVVGRTVSYTALGHLHKPQQVGGGPNVFYAGSALPMSFSEKNYKHGANWIDIDTDGEAAVSRIDYQPLRTLISIPDNIAQAASRAETLEAIRNLPHRQKGDTGDTWPYLEIRLMERQPEPTLLHEVMEELEQRAVHFCRMVRVTPADTSAIANKEKLPADDKLDTALPIDLARRHFTTRYECPMPEELVRRFEEAEKFNEQLPHNEN